MGIWHFLIYLHKISNDINGHMKFLDKSTQNQQSNNRHMAFLDIYFAVSVLVTVGSAHAHCPPGQSGGVYGCIPCPQGTYKVETGPGPCTNCYGWLTTNQTGSTSSNDCYQPCPEGQYIDKEFQCQPCPENTYKMKLMDTCLPCGDGLVTARKGATSISECVPCKRGTYRHWILCIKCPENNTNTCCKRSMANAFVTEKSCDQDCPAVHSNFTWSDFCQPCPLHTYKEEGEIDCKSCPNGTVTKVTGAYNGADCIKTVELASAGQNNTENILKVIVVLMAVSTTACVSAICMILYVRLIKIPCTGKLHYVKNQFRNDNNREVTDKGNVGDDESVIVPLYGDTNSSNKSSDAAKITDTYDHLPFVKHKTSTM